MCFGARNLELCGVWPIEAKWLTRVRVEIRGEAGFRSVRCGRCCSHIRFCDELIDDALSPLPRECGASAHQLAAADAPCAAARQAAQMPSGATPLPLCFSQRPQHRPRRRRLRDSLSPWSASTTGVASKPMLEARTGRSASAYEAARQPGPRQRPATRSKRPGPPLCAACEEKSVTGYCRQTRERNDIEWARATGTAPPCAHRGPCTYCCCVLVSYRARSRAANTPRGGGYSNPALSVARGQDQANPRVMSS